MLNQKQDGKQESNNDKVLDRWLSKVQANVVE